MAIPQPPSAASLPLPPSSRGEGSTLAFAETTTVTLEWRLSGLREMYTTSMGSAKSKCIRSAIFGDPDNLWEVLFYPNSGVKDRETDQNYASLYLWCVPTQQEREQAVGGKWVRPGKWWFKFEIKGLDERAAKPTTLAAPKEASNHQFAAESATNWGWQKFATRDTLFLHPSVAAQDSFIIICQIQAQPKPPAGQWLGLDIPQRVGAPQVASSWTGADSSCGGVSSGMMAAGGPKRVVPRDLITSVGEMLDDPLYSDVEFLIPAPRRAQQNSSERLPLRKVYGNKKLLSRCEYFDSMFHGGFNEGEGLADGESIPDDDIDWLSDSDEEDEAADLLEGPAASDSAMLSTVPVAKSSPPSSPPRQARLSTPPGSDASPSDDEGDGEPPADDDLSAISDTRSVHSSASETYEEATGNADLVTAQGVSAGESAGESAPVVSLAGRKRTRKEAAGTIGPRKTRLVVRDAAWSTWWAVLYWIYTDTIYFAPLSSSFGDPKQEETNQPRTRREWLAKWLLERDMAPSSREKDGAFMPRPVSAKAVFRLADKLDLPSLKLRAFHHICGQMTPHNIPAEVFSRFSSMFEDVRKVQIAFFLEHWGEIKKSDTMQNIWKQIRDGKHVGFEEVWPLIVGQLDFRPS